MHYSSDNPEIFTTYGNEHNHDVKRNLNSVYHDRVLHTWKFRLVQTLMGWVLDGDGAEWGTILLGGPRGLPWGNFKKSALKYEIWGITWEEALFSQQLWSNSPLRWCVNTRYPTWANDNRGKGHWHMPTSATKLCYWCQISRYTHSVLVYPNHHKLGGLLPKHGGSYQTWR